MEGAVAVGEVDDGQDRAVVADGLGEIRLVALIGAGSDVAAGGGDLALGIDEEDRPGAGIGPERLQPLLDVDRSARAERQRQERVARQQKRDDLMALHRALDAAGVEGGAQAGVRQLGGAEAAREVDLTREDRGQSGENDGGDRHPSPETGRHARGLR